MPTPLRILVCGHRSFAATGLVESLRERGHDCVGFTRGRVGRDGTTITGPVDALHENPHLTSPLDVVVNYILLKDEDIARNNDFLKSLLELCRMRGVKHLVHISSISSVKATETLVTEDSASETDPNKKGSYGSLKVSTDQYLFQHAPVDLAMTYFRPGFILGPGVTDPIVGMALRMSNNKLLLMGSAHNVVPITTRLIVTEAVTRAVESTPASKRQMFLLADNNSPTRKQWLQGCCEIVGAGTGVVSFPVWMWLTAAAGGAVFAKVIRMGVKPWKIIRGVCRTQRFDASKTARALGMDLSADWRKELKGSFDNQTPDWEFPHKVVQGPRLVGRRINILGYGGIVRQKHIPAFKKLGFNGEIRAYDLREGPDPKTGQPIRAIEGAVMDDADLHIVASPGPVHNASIAAVRNAKGPILVEKPLCYTEAELNEWVALDAERKDRGRVFVLHNYRYKSNVSQMLAHLARFNPGRLHHVDVSFQSPSVSKDVPWRRAERRARTLLMDYALHFVDLACMFNTGRWDVRHSRHEVNSLDQTSLIEATLQSSTYGVGICLRQGFMPRRCRIFYTFENYGMSLSFFPDTFVPHQTFDSWTLYRWEARKNFRATIAKVTDKLAKRDRDESHAMAIAGAAGESALAPSMSLPRLEQFYRAVFRLADAVYG